LIGENGDNMPAEIGGASTTYYADYFYTNIPESGEAMRGVYFGGSAYRSATAGLSCTYTSYAASHTHAVIGSRLCFLPA
jgi:hypothetical protein